MLTKQVDDTVLISSVGTSLKRLHEHLRDCPGRFLRCRDLHCALLTHLHDQLGPDAFVDPLASEYGWYLEQSGVGIVHGDYPDGGGFDVAILQGPMRTQSRMDQQPVRIGIELTLVHPDRPGNDVIVDLSKFRSYAGDEVGRLFTGVAAYFIWPTAKSEIWLHTARRYWNSSPLVIPTAGIVSVLFAPDQCYWQTQAVL